jgi:transcriptional regulator with XRE-family HTH domain
MNNGETIRLLRNWKRMKQKTIANKLGISQPAYSKLEKCQLINKERLQKIMIILNFSDGELEILKKIISLGEK